MNVGEIRKAIEGLPDHAQVNLIVGDDGDFLSGCDVIMESISKDPDPPYGLRLVIDVNEIEDDDLDEDDEDITPADRDDDETDDLDDEDEDDY